MVSNFFDASVLFEANIEANGSCFLTIYGRHANGYFIAIPNWGICCEASEPNDTYYNAEKLRDVKLSLKSAHAIADAIRRVMIQRTSAEVCA